MNRQKARKLGFAIAKSHPTVDVGTVGIPWQELTALVSHGRHDSARMLLTNLLEYKTDWLQRIASNIKIEVRELDKEWISYFAKRPERLRRIAPREFEKLIFEILLDRGYDVQLTRMGGDGGRDILAIFKSPSEGEVLTIVECKRWKPERKVGIAVVERFLYVMHEKDNAKYGIIATTSYFSRDTTPLAKKWSRELKLRDFNQVVKWLKEYGQWKGDRHSGLWIPNISAL